MHDFEDMAWLAATHQYGSTLADAERSIAAGRQLTAAELRAWLNRSPPRRRNDAEHDGGDDRGRTAGDDDEEDGL